MKRVLLLAFVLLNAICLHSQNPYQWPFPIPNQQGAIIGSVGEFRGSDANPRFHQGVDLTNGSNYAVHSINAGVVTWNGISGVNAIITVTSTNGTSIRYIHTDPLPGIVGSSVALGGQIGNMAVVRDPVTNKITNSKTCNVFI
jgi:murein DD-endopeptidase MepM/ murein hydrolase activator NlpD